VGEGLLCQSIGVVYLFICFSIHEQEYGTQNVLVQHSMHQSSAKEGATSLVRPSCQNVWPQTSEAGFLWWALCMDPAPRSSSQTLTMTVSRLTYVAVMFRRKIDSLSPWTTVKWRNQCYTSIENLKSTVYRLDRKSGRGVRRLYTSICTAYIRSQTSNALVWSLVIWDHTVLQATQQRWFSCLYLGDSRHIAGT